MDINDEVEFWPKEHPKYYKKLLDADVDSLFPKARWVCDLSIQDKDNRWSQLPVAWYYIGAPYKFAGFWTNALERNTKWNVIYKDDISIFNVPALMNVETGELIWSRYTTDLVPSEDNDVFIDGGKERPRTGGRYLDKWTDCYYNVYNGLVSTTDGSK